MILYLTKSTLCLVLLWAFYKLFLEKEKIHQLKRFYLLFSLIFAYTIPLISISYESDPLIITEELQQPVTYVIDANSPAIPVTEKENQLSILWYIYAVGFLIFAVRFIRNIFNLLKRVKTNQNVKEESHVNVLLSNSIVPHTFLKYIFVPKKEFQKSAIPQEIWLHEKTHVKQKHTLDILLVEIFQVIFWFNPIWYWIKKSIRLNHEFLADQTVLKQECSIHNYMDLLVTYPSGPNQACLASPINYSLTKKRIVMMSQQFSKTRAAARLLLLLPILVGCVLLFTNKVAAQESVQDNYDSEAPLYSDKKIKIEVVGEQITVNGKSTDLSNFVNTMDEVTKEFNEEDLTSLNFNVSLQNADDKFLEKLNAEYKKTRLYAINPDKQDLLVPPPPPKLPSLPKVEKEEKEEKVEKEEEVELFSSSVAPVKEAKAVKAAKKAKKSKKCKKTCKKSAKTAHSSQTRMEAHEAEIEHMVAKAVHEAEKVKHEVLSEAVKEEIEKAMHLAEKTRKESEDIRAVAMVEAEKARVSAMEAANRTREKSRIHQEEVMRIAERSRREAERRMTKHSKEARRAMKKAEKHREKARSEATKAREEGRKAQREARSEAMKAREEAQMAARAAIMQAEKAKEEAEMAARAAIMQAEKAKEEAEKAARAAIIQAEKAKEEAEKERN